MRLRLSRLALDDIAQIHDYTATKWGTDQAVKYVNALWDALEDIQRAPNRWRLRPDIHADAHACVSGRHLIIYRVRDERLEVSRILHGSMRLSDHVPEDFLGEDK